MPVLLGSLAASLTAVLGYAVHHGKRMPEARRSGLKCAGWIAGVIGLLGLMAAFPHP